MDNELVKKFEGAFARTSERILTLQKDCIRLHKDNEKLAEELKHLIREAVQELEKEIEKIDKKIDSTDRRNPGVAMRVDRIEQRFLVYFGVGGATMAAIGLLVEMARILWNR